ncbi:MAG TPA: hypothetical protein VNC22_14195 [Sporichthya sp.]|jgi:hypothetical protein|nr:hypothetical protein [Sporichthya sp.]
MSFETIKSPWQVEVGDVILRHPDRPHITGEWRVTGAPKMAYGLTDIPYEMPDGGEGVFVLQPAQTVSVRPAVTYRMHAHLTDRERTDALASASDRERVFLLAQVVHRYPEIFDDAYAHLQKARAADAACLREEVAS